jgi:hypothetical protein
MAEIPYFFETPVPKYFRENGWFTTPNTILFVTWAFSKCSIDARTVVHDHREIKLAPFEFITGRAKSSAESLLTEDAFKHQLKMMLNAGLLKKTPNSTPNRFTCYIWLTDRFCKTHAQLNAVLTPNSRPTERPQSRRKKNRSKEDHPSIPSFNSDELKTDDFSFENEKVEIIPGVWLAQVEIDACILIKGNLEEVKKAIEYIQNSKRRKHPISDWPNALAKWKIENKAHNTIQEHIIHTEKLCKEFEDFEQGNGWRCRMYNDTKKDQRGILFEYQTPYQESFFVSLLEGELKIKCNDFIKNKNMRNKK